MKMMSQMHRRDFLKTASTATLSALAAGYSRSLLGAEGVEEKIKPTADTIIVLWMGGGMASTETFDPKRYTPFEKGIATNDVLSSFPQIDTKVDHIKFSKGLERIANVMDRGTLIRSYTAGDLGFILHSRHQFHWHTGYQPPQTVACPHIGAVIARTLGPLNPAVPAFINIGQRFDNGEGEELKAFTTAGFLGSEHGPFNIPLPEQAAESVRPPRALLDESGVSVVATATYNFRSGRGCQHCRGSGYRGRKAIGELLIMNDEIREAFIARVPVRQLKEMAVSTGVRFIRDAAMDLVRTGETTLEEVNRVTTMA